ncbi:MAG: caspase family protein [Muribaculaceae bacterium]|nr:caspase family protein [Muribaculaceae bacterium]
MKTLIKLFLALFLSCPVIHPIRVLAQENTAKVYILRKQTIGTPIKPDISVNNISVGQLPNKKYIECTVPAGNIEVSVHFSASENSEKYINFRADAGKTYYIKTSVDASNSFNFNMNQSMNMNQTSMLNVNLSRLMDSEGEKLLKKCKQELFADITDYVSSDMPAYANQTDNPAPQNINAPGNVNNANIAEVVTKSDVDVNIPETDTQNKNTFVLIIANEDYSFVDNVQYALHDGQVFREYCIKTLGIPERQIWLYKNASLGIISSGVNKMVQAMNIFNDAKAIIYYCGHGIPDEKSGDAYIVPVDGTGTDITSCYSLNKLYQTIGSANPSNVTYFMDACFTGANRDGSMLVAARGVAREPKKEIIKGNSIVFSAASGDETAMPFKDKGHGLFTYFLLKKLQESKGNVTYGELSEYLNENVKREAFLTNEKPQNPVVATSENLSKSWKNIKFK